MPAIPILFGWDAQAELRARLEQSQKDDVTYPEVGATRSAALPAGYKHWRSSLQVGRGDADWERAKDAIRLWKAQTNAGISITPADAPVAEGTTVLVNRTLGPITFVAPCRVVYVTDEPNRFGFAYGTLPGHPESGEESFHVGRDPDGGVTAEVVVFARPGNVLTRLLGPIAQKAEDGMNRRYLKGIQAYTLGTT